MHACYVSWKETAMIRLRDDIVFEKPESRIREYCAVEIYQGYDDQHSVSNNITRKDIDAANELYAMIDRYDKGESTRLLSYSKNISSLLSSIPNIDIFAVSNQEWLELRNKIEKLLARFLSIKGIGLAKATKILHLKRPNLIPVLDSFVIKFLLDVNISEEAKSSCVNIGLQALDRVRKIIARQKVAFEKLVEQTSDLPIQLTPVRMFDILCWTAEKWDIRGKHSAPYGTPSKSLLSPPKLRKDRPLAPRRIEGAGEYVVFEDLERATGPKVHHVNCFYYRRWLSNPTTTTTWHGPYESEEKAWEICKRLSSKSGFKPSKHSCVRQ
jgi:hypothetical protein